MRKCSVYSLYVIKVDKGDTAHYFICERKYSYSNIYVEIFTKQKITVDDQSCIEPLCNWYSILEQYNFSTGEVLMLTKKQLLLKYIEINNYYTEKRIEEKHKNTYKKKK